MRLTMHSRPERCETGPMFAHRPDGELEALCEKQNGTKHCVPVH